MSSIESNLEKIQRHIESVGWATGPDLARMLGISRQAVSAHLRKLISEGKVHKTGSTRAARYFPVGKDTELRRMRRELVVEGLDESVAYEGMAISLNLGRIPDHIETIVNYAFTELLNNVVDHSMSRNCTVDMRVDSARISFSIRDTGVGVFWSIADKFELEDEQAALIELVKGKTTTQPHAHSGEGLFFVSRSADRFLLRSHRLQIEWDREKNDAFVSDQRLLKGTLVEFSIRRNSRTRLEDVFARYAPEEHKFEFQKTRVLVKLMRKDYVSRSEAKRLMFNLDKFSEVELDMRNVTHVGQGFADEIFRVFTGAHPDTDVFASHAGKAASAMIKHSGGRLVD